jgi:hypothetical protein
MATKLATKKIVYNLHTDEIISPVNQTIVVAILLIEVSAYN